MEIRLNDGKSFEVESYQKDSFSIKMPGNKIYDTIVLLTRGNVSGATIIEKNISDSKKEDELFKFGEVNLSEYNVQVVDEHTIIAQFYFEELTETEIELAKQRSEMDALHNIIVLGLNNAEPKYVIQWAKFLDEWNGYKYPYRKGERFKYRGNPYEVLDAVTSDGKNTPDKDTKHYKLLTIENDKKQNYKQWNKDVAYNKGDVCIARGILFISKIDNNKGNEPGYGNTWDYYKEN